MNHSPFRQLASTVFSVAAIGLIFFTLAFNSQAGPRPTPANAALSSLGIPPGGLNGGGGYGDPYGGSGGDPYGGGYGYGRSCALSCNSGFVNSTMILTFTVDGYPVIDHKSLPYSLNYCRQFMPNVACREYGCSEVYYSGTVFPEGSGVYQCDL